jgi:hypothetical protein
MTEFAEQIRPRNPIATSRFRFKLKLKRFSALAFIALLMGVCPLHAGEEEDEYLRIFNIIQKGDDFNTSGKSDKALANYQEAQSALQNLRKTYPAWNSKMVTFRQNYVAEKIQALTEKPAPDATGTAQAKRDAQTGPKVSANSAAEAQVKLLEAGAEPRRVLRLHPKPGDKQTLTMLMNIGIDIKMGDMAGQAMKLPNMKMVMEVTVKNVAADGDIAFETVIHDAEINEDPNALPQVVAAMKSSIGNLKGLAGTGTLSSQGINKGSEIKLAANVDPQTRQVMDQMQESFARMTAPMPEEAIGPGAKWTLKVPLKSQGMLIQHEAKYELNSVEGDVLKLTSIVTQSAAGQKIESPAMPGLKMDLVKMTGEGTGKATVDLARLVPTEGNMSFRSDTSISMDVGGQKQPMNMKTQMEIHTEGK